MNDTRSYILETTFLLFMQKSFKEVTMKEIVTKTGLSKGAFYHYFASKEQLFNEVIDTYYATFFEIDYSQFNQDSLYEFYHDELNYMENEIKEVNRGLASKSIINTLNFYLLIFDAIRLVPGFQKRITEMNRREMEGWTKVIGTARKNGEIKSIMTDDQIAKIFVHTNDGIGIHGIMLGQIDTLRVNLLDIWDSFYEVLKS